MRIIAGEKKGFRLKAPSGQATRPTLGRVRESLFMRLMPMLEGASVLDLFSGAGTLGLEALSRGASKAVFVDTSRPAMVALADNLARLGWTRRGIMEQRDALRWLRGPSPEGAPWDLVLIDPPYGQDLAARTLEILGERAAVLLNLEAIVVAQVGRRDQLAERYGALSVQSRHKYGDTVIFLYARDNGEATQAGDAEPAVGNSGDAAGQDGESRGGMGHGDPLVT